MYEVYIICIEVNTIDFRPHNVKYEIATYLSIVFYGGRRLKEKIYTRSKIEQRLKETLDVYKNIFFR